MVGKNLWQVAHKPPIWGEEMSENKDGFQLVESEKCKTEEGLKEIVKRHLCFWRMGCFLWWWGGFVIFVLIRILHYANGGRLYSGRELTYHMIAVFMLALSFGLAAKNVNKKSNGDEVQTSPKHKDRFKGELWVWFIFTYAVMTIHDFLVPGFKFLGWFGEIKSIPETFFLVVYGSSTILGFSRASDLWKIIKDGLPFFVKKIP